MPVPSAPFAAPWDIFCSVVDNFGDIGICWRLARQLVAEHDLQVRLWVDDLAAFRAIAPVIDPALDLQQAQGVEVRRWTTPFPAAVEPAAVVIEALCAVLPDSYQEAMARRATPPLWLKLEYLSAEPWVTGCHGLASPHPRLPLTKHFFFPGFTAATGGLLRERALAAQRDAFQADPAAQAEFWRGLGLAPKRADELRLSLFGYGSADLGGLLALWEAAERPVTCLVPDGLLARQAAAHFGLSAARPGDRYGRGALAMAVLPLLEQERYDCLLWGCDLNFVRGEDSFVRAQWAGRPLVWQPYRQEEATHAVKLEAFLALYTAGLEEATAGPLRDFWRAWNREAGVAAAWAPFAARLDGLAAHAARWWDRQSALDDLATRLVLFCTKPL